MLETTATFEYYNSAPVFLMLPSGLIPSSTLFIQLLSTHNDASGQQSVSCVITISGVATSLSARVMCVASARQCLALLLGGVK